MVEKSKESEAIWRVDALRKVLMEVHSLFAMFNGSIRALLEKEPGGELARSHLYPFVMDYLCGKSFCNGLPTESLIPVFYCLWFKIFHCKVTNCQHIKSGLHWMGAAGVILTLKFQLLSIGFLLPK